MSIISVVIPFSETSEDRKRNLFYTIKYYKKHLPLANIIVVEQDTNADFSSISEKIDKHIKIDTGNDLFNRALLLNKGFNASQTDFCSDYIIFGDADCLIEKSILENIEQYYIYFDNNFVVPYTNKMYYLSSKETDKFIYNNEDNINNNEIRDLDNVIVMGGGVNILSAINFYKIGGFDERFKGWGAEDDAFHNKSIGLGLSIHRLKGELLHLNHTTVGRNMNNYGNNLNLYSEIFSNSNFKEYIDSLGYDHLVKPCTK